ncbi:MAG: hypothetical protein WC544_03300 [Patescibacteria group bacterium]
MKKLLCVLGLAVLLMVPAAAYGQTETMVFDSTDGYIGACSYTATSTWTLTQDMDISTFQMWYYWQAGETELPITVTKDGAEFAVFTATRTSCDPYQTSWCNADFAINKTFPAGTYTTTIPNAYQCLKPGGTGTVRLYSMAATSDTDTGTEPDLIATANANTNEAGDTHAADLADDSAVTPLTTDDEEEGDVLVLYVLIGIIVVLVLVIIFMGMKCCKKTSPKQ